MVSGTSRALEYPSNQLDEVTKSFYIPAGIRGAYTVCAAQGRFVTVTPNSAFCNATYLSAGRPGPFIFIGLVGWECFSA